MKKNKIKLKCLKCEKQLFQTNNNFQCEICNNKYQNIKGVYRFVKSDFHSNFGFQWQLFNKTQLDSVNKSNESRNRFFLQSEMSPQDFENKKILEVGSGAGRFTEILKDFKSEIYTVDYSDAIIANYENNNQNNVIFLQADIFNLPFFKNYFDIVICYGVIQHTGDNQRAIESLAELTKNNGTLLLDIYSNSIRHYNPWIYLIRKFFFILKISNEKKYKIVKKIVNILFPFYLTIFKFLNNYKKNIFCKYIKFFFNRAPISVYGINLYLDNKINIDIAKEWSLLDTYDAWTPKFDHPVSLKKWYKMIEIIKQKYKFNYSKISESGQGYTARLIKNNK